MFHTRLLSALACAALCLSGCQRAADAATEAAIEHASGRKVEVARDGDRVTFKSEQGELSMQAGESLPLPADFPKDVWLPTAYNVNSVMDMAGVQVVSVRTQGKVSGLHADARAAMAEAGWKQTMSMQHSADNAMLSFEKAERAAVLSFNRAEGDGGVLMSVQLRQSRQ